MQSTNVLKYGQLIYFLTLSIQFFLLMLHIFGIYVPKELKKLNLEHKKVLGLKFVLRNWQILL